ncbi:coproporphyrinogen III oxidase [Sulfurimonas sp. HSL3-7]|uniref:coproporphyrinogen III oxidase n=1 Tax=Sulfonitrofixus jiaomeiensis TaxID=3131938 RepID=UPI0031F86570
MNRTSAASATAKEANAIVEHLQLYFVERLNALSREFGDDKAFDAVEWFRDGGRHGGGLRYMATDDSLFNRGSVNVSQVHYDDDAEKKLGSATALSTIIHPFNPLVPSIHMHISWTEMKSGKGYWRVMADLNPAIEIKSATQQFTACLKTAAPEQFEAGAAQGDRYFNIPALGRHRGVSHFYLESFSSGDAAADKALARHFGEKMVDCYIDIVRKALAENPKPAKEDFEKQLAYHTLYLFQVLTLDRGTTSGLLVHDQNDVGIMGSIPRYVDKSLLASWKALVPPPQEKLVQGLVDALEGEGRVLVDDAAKQRLAKVVRAHYKAHPEALSMQASGDIVPPTVDNHK